LRDRNIKGALLSIAEGFERLGSRAQDMQRSEQPVPVRARSADAAGSAARPVDESLADAFRALEVLAQKPPPPATASPDRIERVARALCRADGRDPDRAIETGQWETVAAGGMQTRRPVTIRGWNAYEKNARQFLAALDAALGRDRDLPA
jgi:hypothetical protein